MSTEFGKHRVSWETKFMGQVMKCGTTKKSGSQTGSQTVKKKKPGTGAEP